MTLNCGIQNGTVPLVALAVGVVLGTVATDEVLVPDDVTVLPDGCGAVPDEVGGNELPPGEEDKLPPLSVDDVSEPVLLGVGCPGEPVLVVNVEGALGLALLGVEGKEVAVLGIDNERLVSVLVVCRGVLGDTEPIEGVDTLAEPLVELDRVDSVVGTGTLPGLEEPGVWVDELGEPGRPLDVAVEPSSDEILPVAEETVDVTSSEELSVPETVGELVLPLPVVEGSVWVSALDVNDVEED